MVVSPPLLLELQLRKQQRVRHFIDSLRKGIKGENRNGNDH